MYFELSVYKKPWSDIILGMDLLISQMQFQILINMYM